MTPVQWLLVALVLYTPYGLYFDFSTGIPLINVANFLFLAAVLALHQQHDAGAAVKTPLKGHFLLFFAVLTVSLIICLLHGGTAERDELLLYKNAIYYPCLYFLFFAAARDLKTVRVVYAAILLATALASLQAVRQGLDYGLTTFNETHRAGGPFSHDWTNSNRAGVYYATFTPCFAAFAVMMRRQYPRLRLVALGCLAIGIFATFVTYSRQAYFILGFSLALLLLRSNLLWLIVAGIAVANIDYWVPDAAVQRVTMTAQTDAAGDVALEESAESRLIIWRGAREMIKEHPAGVGIGRFHSELGNYSEIKGMDAHNAYILTVAESGVFGGLVLATLLIRLLFVPWRLMWHADPQAQTLGWSFFLATIGVIIGNFYSSSLYFGEAIGDYWALAGLTARALFLWSSPAEPARTVDAAVAAPARRTL